MENKEITFGDYIKTIRHGKGLTLKEVSELMDNGQYVSNSYLSKLESNVRLNPTMDTVAAICKAYNLSLNEVAKFFGINEVDRTDDLKILLLNSKYIFADRIADGKTKLLLNDLINYISLYVNNKTIDRDIEGNILKTIDSLKLNIQSL
ncbi:helix-turn-helix domain-containing protein [Clostridium butyricum]|uniref:helix-turn-helix domain-containing protein n=1 Tax=Clostridium butyricum TaxID=1492 RepID=UPI0005C23B00|nr:helix-turn-helix transcriptional regulator [Clostridium butyricum]KIU07780.1 helix-turn-helix domain protein [Clostridium butyricum]MBA8967611.1 transcriptional regulator with XRE-family HTH domain [Clostridium butyricum]MBA8971322.1 transcriptional regulator with XRE-family HTH domain [Clostridium butyricum]MBC2429384.1 helix-turn-helix transcriptional regulator [Clostridium butyricum]NOW36812.1 transcriptional regulator with XRE-family HTH domain [Clostridium butyricum]